MSPASVLRPGQPADAEALARLHVTVWRETYGAIAPPEAVRALDETRRLPNWRATLSDPDPITGAIVAEHAGAILGVVSYGRPAQPEIPAAFEIRHLYVLSAARGTGLGAALLRAGLDRCSTLGLPDAALAVVRQNSRARRFYAAMGGVETGSFLDAGPLWRSENVIVRWPITP